MTERLQSKAWDWSLVSVDTWNQVSDEFLPVALRQQKLQKNKVLDLGCGRGRHSIFLAEMGFQVTAVDLSPEGIDQLKKEAQKQRVDGSIETLVCDMLELPFGKESFDFVLAFNSIYHTDYIGLKIIITSIKNLLADSGQAFITFSSKSSASFNDLDYKAIDGRTIIKGHGVEEGIPHTYLDYNDITELMSDFQIQKLQLIQTHKSGKVDYRYFVEASK